MSAVGVMDIATLGSPPFAWEEGNRVAEAAAETPPSSLGAQGDIGTAQTAQAVLLAAGGRAAAAGTAGSKPRLLEPGEGWLRDFRTAPLTDADVEGLQQAAIRVLSWDVERGYDVEGIVAFLREQDADVILLQEVDIGCIRTGSRDVVREIGEALGLNTFFGCVFQELQSEERAPREQGGGMHGLAVLTKFEITGAQLKRHSGQPFDWAADGGTLATPRKGERLFQEVRLKTPIGSVVFHNVDLESQCGIEGRLCQLADVLDVCHDDASAEIIAGSFGTTSRLWYSLMGSEAQYWEDNLWDDEELALGFDDPFGPDAMTFSWTLPMLDWLTSYWWPTLTAAKADHMRIKGVACSKAELLGHLPEPGCPSDWLSPHLCLSAVLTRRPQKDEVAVQII